MLKTAVLIKKRKCKTCHTNHRVGARGVHTVRLAQINTSRRLGSLARLIRDGKACQGQDTWLMLCIVYRTARRLLMGRGVVAVISLSRTQSERVREKRRRRGRRTRCSPRLRHRAMGSAGDSVGARGIGASGDRGIGADETSSSKRSDGWKVVSSGVWYAVSMAATGIKGKRIVGCLGLVCSLLADRLAAT